MTNQVYLKEAKDILQSEFKFGTEQSRIIYYDKADWNEVLRRRNQSITGFFQPRTLEAHISSHPQDTLLTRTIHEYLGHGSYCEHSQNGRRIVRFEQQLISLETEIIRRDLPKNMKIALKEGEKTSLRKSEDPEFDYILYVNREDQSLQEYLVLKNQYEDFFQQNILTYEGFAVWLEEFLLKKLDLNGLWDIRQDKIGNTQYQEFYREFKKFEQSNGTLSLIYKVGFPKRFDKDSILKVVSEHVDTRNFSFLILYGSRREYGDIDILAVGPNKRDNVYTEDLDVVCVSEIDLVERLKLFDLELTEPFLTGEVVLGDRNLFEQIKKQLFEQEFTEEAANFLRRKSLLSFNYANHYYQQGSFEAIQELIRQRADPNLIRKVINGEVEINSRYFLYSLNNLSYVLSCSLAQELYKDNHGPLTLKEITEKTDNPVLKQIREYAKNIKSGIETPKNHKTKELIEKTKSLIISQ